MGGFDALDTNHSNVEGLARTTLCLMLTGRVYYNDMNTIKFFGAENYPHIIITEEEMIEARRDNLRLLF